MRICVLLSSYQESSSPFSDVDPYYDPSPWLLGHQVERHFLNKRTAKVQLDQLARCGFDVFINLCDGAVGEDLAGLEVVQELERLRVPFTGADSHCYEPTREELKQACRRAGVDSPRYVLATDQHGVDLAGQQLRFPLIVKHPNSYGSIGMGRDARVATRSALDEPAARMVSTYGGALIEEFIEGSELTVLVSSPAAGETSPRTWAPLEINFPIGETFKHFDLKWHSYASMRWLPVEDEGLATRAREATARVFAEMGCTGYARCDLRVSRDGGLFMLDLNANPGAFYPEPGSTDEILACEPDGHARFLEHIIDHAFRRAR